MKTFLVKLNGQAQLVEFEAEKIFQREDVIELTTGSGSNHDYEIVAIIPKHVLTYIKEK